jgi:2-polyprenyl-3-methyl-5-hydroxy-6-metoxy-1,4-benzoquinol methylase
MPRPAPEELRALYTGDYAGASARKFGRSIEAGRRLFARVLAARIVRRVGAGGRALDIGCGDGKVLAALARRGFDCTGIELNPRVHETLPRDAKITIHTGALSDAQLPPASFRVVILRHVLEHLDDPLRALSEVRRVIAPDGTLIVAVPNLASWQARMARCDWFHLDLPRHLHHFTPAALRTLLARAGFTVDRVSHFSLEQNPYGWLQSAFNRAGGRWGTLYEQLRAEGAAQARRLDGVALGAGLLLLPFFVALASVESAAGAGGTIEAWARPAR